MQKEYNEWGHFNNNQAIRVSGDQVTKWPVTKLELVLANRVDS